MASHVVIGLRTTPPASVALTLAGGAAKVSSTAVAALLTTTDPDTTGYQAKFWGDVEGAATEGAASWVALASPNNITLTGGDAVKTVNAKMRDNVGNEITVAVSDTVELDTTLPTVTVNSGPTAAEISEVSGFDRSSFTWSVGEVFDEYKVKVVGNISDPHTAGTQIPTTAGSSNVAGSAGGYPASTNITTEVDGSDLKTASAPDGDKITKVFVRVGADWSA